MSYYVEPFVKPIKTLGVNNEGHDLKALEFFRYERNHSPMVEVVREHLARAALAGGAK